SPFMPVTSSPSMTILPLLGSIRRLIIFSVVVLPQPEGPTNITMEPAGISRVRPPTADFFCPGQVVVTSSSMIEAPVTFSATVFSEILLSDTDTSRGGQSANAEQNQVKDER